MTVAPPALPPTVADTAWEESAKFEECFLKLFPADGPSPIDLLIQVDCKFAEFAPMLKLAPPRRSLIDWI